MNDPLGAAIEAAVSRALEAQLPSIIDALKQSIEATKSEEPVQDNPDRFVKLSEACSILGVHKTTILRQEKLGKLPKRRRVGEASGYLMSDLRKIMEAA